MVKQLLQMRHIYRSWRTQWWFQVEALFAFDWEHAIQAFGSCIVTSNITCVCVEFFCCCNLTQVYNDFFLNFQSFVFVSLTRCWNDCHNQSWRSQWNSVAPTKFSNLCIVYFVFLFIQICVSVLCLWIFLLFFNFREITWCQFSTTLTEGIKLNV